jgi:hypothetical protein
VVLCLWRWFKSSGGAPVQGPTSSFEANRSSQLNFESSPGAFGGGSDEQQSGSGPFVRESGSSQQQFSTGPYAPGGVGIVSQSQLLPSPFCPKGVVNVA